MNRPLLALVTLLLLAPTLSFAAWISPVDQKYKKRNPGLYAQIEKAGSMLSDSNGRGDIDAEALAIVQAVIVKDPGFAPAYVQRARAFSNLGYQSSGQFDPDSLAAREVDLKKALSLEPAYDYAIALMGYTKMAEGKLDEAEGFYKQAQKLKSTYPLLKSQIAHLEFEKKNYRGAIDLAAKGFQEHQADRKVAVAYVTELIFAYEELAGNHGEELEKWQATRTKLAPETAWYWGDRARFRLFYMHDYASAIPHGEKALSLMDYGVGRFTLAAAYYAKWADLNAKSPDSAEAAIALKRAESLSPLTQQMVNLFLSRPEMVQTGVALARRMKAPGGKPPAAR